MPIEQVGYDRNKQRAIDYFNMQPKLFVIDGYAGEDQHYRKNIRILTSRPYHALFMKNMLLRDTN